MKRTLCLLTALLLAALFSACQPTPDTEYIVQKDTERVIEQAGIQGKGTAIEELGVPIESYAYDFVDPKGRLHILADAQIVLPDTEYIPVVRVSGTAFTEKDVTALYTALCSDNTHVDAQGALPKAYYQKMLDGLLQQRESGQLDMQYHSVEALDEAIAAIMQEASAAPEKPTAIDPNYSFDTLDGCAAQIFSMPDEETLSELLAQNDQETGNGISAEYLRDVTLRTEFSRQTTQGESISAIYGTIESRNIRVIQPEMDENAAFAIANQVIAQLGLSDFSCSGKRLAPVYDQLSETEQEHGCKGVYEFMFTRSVNGVAITYTNDTMSAETPDKNEVNTNVSKPWLYEKIRIFVDDEGIFALLWNAPYVVTEVVNERATMLPFEQIRQIFEDLMPLKYGQYDKDSAADKVEISVKEVRLGLARIAERGKTAQAVLVPVWDFFGTVSGTGRYTLGSDGYDSLLTINAIDGSIINRSLGY